MIPVELQQWEDWRPLATASVWAPRAHGLYRVRRARMHVVDYIGQTSGRTMSLAIRLGMLKGVYGAVMPYADPHVAGPALWAMRDATGCEFEASVTPVAGSVQRRKGLETAAIALYRLETGRSPTLNFGRMLAGYRKSSANNARLAAAGTRCRGGACPDADATHLPGIAPLAGPDEAPAAPDWGGLGWASWGPADRVRRLARSARGLYRLRRPGDDRLVYVGEGSIAARVLSHLAKAENTAHRQAGFFAGPLEGSWALGEWPSNQRLELENDLVGAHVIAFGDPPVAQFLG